MEILISGTSVSVEDTRLQIRSAGCRAF